MLILLLHGPHFEHQGLGHHPTYLRLFISSQNSLLVILVSLPSFLLISELTCCNILIYHEVFKSVEQGPFIGKVLQSEGKPQGFLHLRRAFAPSLRILYLHGVWPHQYHNCSLQIIILLGMTTDGLETSGSLTILIRLYTANLAAKRSKIIL